MAGSDPELPPLSVQETERIIGQIASVVDDQQLVLIGGQAIALWRAQLAAYLPAGAHTVTSRDVDLQGSRDALEEIARLLDGRSRLASFDDHTPLAGVVVFVDADGYERQLDVLPRPFGLDGAAVARNAPLLHLRPDIGRGAKVRVMHPVDVLRSRVANSALADKQTERAAQQLHAAVALVPAYGQMLLDHGADPRLVTNMNESVFRLAYKDARALRLYLNGTADIADAVLYDVRLPEAYLSTRFPQLRRQLAAERKRLANRALSYAPNRRLRNTAACAPTAEVSTNRTRAWISRPAPSRARSRDSRRPLRGPLLRRCRLPFDC